MGNLSNTATLYISRIDKGGINEKTLQSLLEQDNDFSENTDQYREDTLELGFENEAERVSKEIFDKYKDRIEEDGEDFDEFETLSLMVKDLFNVEGYIGCSSYYGDYTYEIIETDFEYIVVIATIM